MLNIHIFKFITQKLDIHFSNLQILRIILLYLDDPLIICL